MIADIHTVAQGEHSRVVQPRQTIIRSDEEWRALWAAHSGPEVAEPHVDFGSRMVAAVFAGERPSPGYEISIAGARRENGGYVLLVSERPPLEGTLAAQVVTTPFHIVSLPRYDGPVEFAGPGQARARPAAASGVRAPRRRHEAAPSSTGLAPTLAGSLAYLAGPFSGALLLITETSSRFVRFHAWQALIGLGALGLAALMFLGLAFVMLLMSPGLFWAMLWIAAIAGILWVLLWAICVVQAYRGRLWKLPFAGSFAERRAGLSR